MRSNGLLKWLMIPVALLVLFVAIRLFSGGSTSAPPAADAGSKLTPEEMKALGIEGDTPRDTVATLVAQVKQLRTELQTALTDNKSQREENQRLRQRENSIDQRINSALESERSNLRRDQEQAASARQQTEGLLADLQRRLDSIGGRGGGHADLPVGLGLQGGDEAGMEGGVRWVEPDDAKPAEGRNGGRGASGGMSFPTSFGPAQSTLETTAETVANAGARAAGVPGMASTASTLKRAWTSGKATTLFKAVLSFSITAAGVPAGAASAKKFCTSKPLNPASVTCSSRIRATSPSRSRSSAAFALKRIRRSKSRPGESSR